MKTRLIILLTVIAITNSIFSQIPNNGFENWTNMGSYSTPDNWGNLNAVTTAAGGYTCVKGSPGVTFTSITFRLSGELLVCKINLPYQDCWPFLILSLKTT